MRRIMLVGRTGAGKTSFCQVMNGQELRYQKTQAIEFLDNAIDTPGEYVENRKLYAALSVTAAEADLIVLVQDCSDREDVFSPGMAAMFDKPVIGVVTKVDLDETGEQTRHAADQLELAGCEKIFRLSNVTGAGVRELVDYLEQSE